MDHNVVTGDDTVDVWLNGKPLAGSPRVAGSWRNALYVDLRSALKPGSNTIALASRSKGGHAGVIGRVRVRTAGHDREPGLQQLLRQHPNIPP